MTDPLLLFRVLVLLGVANGVPVLARKLCKNRFAAPSMVVLNFSTDSRSSDLRRPFVVSLPQLS